MLQNQDTNTDFQLAVLIYILLSRLSPICTIRQHSPTFLNWWPGTGRGGEGQKEGMVLCKVQAHERTVSFEGQARGSHASRAVSSGIVANRPRTNSGLRPTGRGPQL